MAVAAMWRWTRKGVAVVTMGKEVLKYVKETSGRVLNYGPLKGRASREGQGLKRQNNMVEVFADISLASGGEDRSVQGIIGFVDGAPICWESVRQPFVAQSTAEGELGDERWWHWRRWLLERKFIRKGCMVTIWRQPGVEWSWKLADTPFEDRASALRWALEEGEWVLEHMPGAQLVVDGLAKLLKTLETSWWS